MSRGMINIFYDEHNLKEELKKEVTLVSFDSKGSKDLSMFTDSILQFNPQYVIIDFPLERDEALKFSDGEGDILCARRSNRRFPQGFWQHGTTVNS